MKRRTFVGALGAGLNGWRPRRRDVFTERWSWAMGQPVHIMVFAGSEDEGLDACAAALADLRRVEAHLTLFDTGSDLCELNRRAGRKPMRVDGDLRSVLRIAETYRHATGGAFDVAVEPLMRVWGFHRPRRMEPTAAEISAARDAVRSAVVRLDGETAELPASHTQLDFGGIGVGYGIDRSVAVLRSRGIRRAFIDVSGDCYAVGAPPGSDGWRVGIADPASPGSTIAEHRLRDAGLATSSNLVSVVRYAAEVRGHVMNPMTGWPATTLRQATIVARSAVAADALAKALLITGRCPAGAIAAYWL